MVDLTLFLVAFAYIGGINTVAFIVLGWLQREPLWKQKDTVMLVTLGTLIGSLILAYE